MSVKMAVLGLVIERPGYGYDLAQRLDERCGAWRWNTTGVYGALSSLEREGHVLSRARSGTSTRRGTPRAMYDATDTGLEHFRDWMLAPSQPAPLRQELDLKLALATPELLPEMINLILAQEQQCVDGLQDLTTHAQPSTGFISWPEMAVVHEREKEILHLNARIKWLQNVRKTMRLCLEQAARQR